MSIAASLERLVAAWNAQDVESIVAAFAEDGAYHEPEGPDRLGRSHVGHAAIRAILTQIFATFPDGRLDPVGPAVIDGDHAHAEWDFAFSAADGRRRTVRGVDLFTFENGRIKHKNVFLKRYVR
ncbi:MAG: nuclear transport factor 2 family protein [Gammaproteobacteria bacterium]